MLIRDETEQDIELIHDLHRQAFETNAEADLVAALRQEAHPHLSLILEEGMRLVGHIMFSPMHMQGHVPESIMGLAPMAVVPDRQRSGFGTALVVEGLVRLRARGCGAVFVLGHPGFYPRFGFSAASAMGINCEYDVPDDVFMVHELTADYLKGAQGVVKYHPAFNKL